MEIPIPLMTYASIYKGLLQEQCRKFGLCDPVYVVYKEGGEDHMPTFTAKAMIHKLVFQSVGRFHTSKDAEQTAARVAIVELYRAQGIPLNLTQMVHDAGLFKAMLQEYAHRARLSRPVYECRKTTVDGYMPVFTCTVTVGGSGYQGLAGRTKRAAEKNAALVACASIMAMLSANASASDILNAAR